MVGKQPPSLDRCWLGHDGLPGLPGLVPGFQTIGASSFLPDGSHVLYLKRLGNVGCGKFSYLLAVVCLLPRQTNKVQGLLVNFSQRADLILLLAFSPIFHVILCRILGWVEHCFCFFSRTDQMSTQLLIRTWGLCSMTPGVRNTEVCHGSSMRRMCQLEKLWLLRVHRRGQVRMELLVQFSRQIAAQNIGRLEVRFLPIA